MCGIAGFVGGQDTRSEPEIVDLLRVMTAVQAHRGPDGEGLWTGMTGQSRIGVGHRRLAILDLSPAGAQPFISRCGDYVLTYNGELYNYIELRNELRALGCVFESESDTEVVLQAYITWEMGAFSRFNGMWALAVVDRRRNRVVLSRDRFGEKPLYTYHRGGEFHFASELKAICAGTKDRFRIHLPAAGRFLSQAILAAQPESFLEGITQVPAGHTQIVDCRGPAIHVGTPTPYWTLELEAAPTTVDDAIERVRELLIDAVRLRLRSDVPVGVLLSGGLDSSSLAAIIRQLQPDSQPFLLSAVSDVMQYNEEPYAECVAKHLGSDLHKVRLDPDPSTAFAEMEAATWHNDEPIGAFSVVAHLMLMRRARDLGVTVLLSGQGGDETLCGYLKYMPFFWQQLLRDRRFGTLTKEALVQACPPWPFLSSFRLGEAKRYLSPWLRPGDRDVLGPAFLDRSWALDLSLGDGLASRQIKDLGMFSVPALTHYEDRMSMASSREIRLPFLDHRLVSLLVNLPLTLKLRNGWSKWILRRVMSSLLPKPIVWRRTKQGFSNPVEMWLRGAWRQRVEDILHSNMVTASLGLVDADRLRHRYKLYCEGTGGGRDATDIFVPLALELWARRYAHAIA
jgi:asparagine synthase (glutamine-hydrolysing)